MLVGESLPAYVANFNSNNVSGYAIDPTTGALTAISGSPFAAGSSPAPWPWRARSNTRGSELSGLWPISLEISNCSTPEH